jgi:hypothetical protein
MINPSLPSFGVDIKVFQVVVKVNISGTKVAAQEGGMGCKNGGDG